MSLAEFFNAKFKHIIIYNVQNIEDILKLGGLPHFKADDSKMSQIYTKTLVERIFSACQIIKRLIKSDEFKELEVPFFGMVFSTHIMNIHPLCGFTESLFDTLETDRSTSLSNDLDGSSVSFSSAEVKVTSVLTQVFLTLPGGPFTFVAFSAKDFHLYICIKALGGNVPLEHA